MTQDEFNSAVLDLLEEIARKSNMSDDDYNSIDEKISKLGRNIPIQKSESPQ